MNMNDRYDTYLLYEYMKKVSYTVRILVKLKENVVPELLNEAAQEAISRYPYFSVKVRVDEAVLLCSIIMIIPSRCFRKRIKGLCSVPKRPVAICSR